MPEDKTKKDDTESSDSTVTSESSDSTENTEGSGSSDSTELNDAGKNALEVERKGREQERKARKRAEREKKEMEGRLEKLENEKLSADEKLRKEATDGADKARDATEKLRKANLLMALSEKGLTGPKAKAAVKLLDELEYDDVTDEPKELDDAITAAKAVYGDATFTPDAMSESKDNKEGDNEGDGNPDLHEGARRSTTKADQAAEAEKLDRYMKTNFPQLTEVGASGED